MQPTVFYLEYRVFRVQYVGLSVLPFRNGVCLCIFSMCASTLQVVFASTLLVICSWGGGGGGGEVALSFRRSDQCCVSLFVGHAVGHSNLYGAFLAFV